MKWIASIPGWVYFVAIFVFLYVFNANQGSETTPPTSSITETIETTAPAKPTFSSEDSRPLPVLGTEVPEPPVLQRAQEFLAQARSHDGQIDEKTKRHILSLYLPSTASTPKARTFTVSPPPGKYVAQDGSWYGQIDEKTGRPKTVFVQGRYLKDGKTFVRGHYSTQTASTSTVHTPSVSTRSTPYRVAENGSYYGETSATTGRPKTVFVNGYYRKDGTYVRSYYRSAPSGTTAARAPPASSAGRVAENGSYYGQTSKATGRPKTVRVRGYYRKDGTYVRGHYRSRPRR